MKSFATGACSHDGSSSRPSRVIDVVARIAGSRLSSRAVA
jgi:hypothetical protein